MADAAVRWRPETGWEFRCAECARRNRSERFWPLTDEYWDRHRGMRRCRACLAANDSRLRRARFAKDPERRRAQTRAYRRATRDAQRIKAAAKWQETLADPVKHEAAKKHAREATRRMRARQRAAA
jgi:hypothetical protein